MTRILSPRARRSGRRTSRPLRGLAVLALAAAVAGPGSGRADAVSVALLPLVVHSAESPEYLQAGLGDMLSARLSQVEGLAVVRVEDDATATSKLESALVSGRDAGADFVLFGSFTRFGEGASLDVQCAATSGESPSEPLREIFVHSGSIGDVIPDLDSLVGKVVRFVIRDYALRDQSAPELSRPAEAESRTALEALRRRIDRLEEEVTTLRRSQGEQLAGGAAAGAEPATP